MQQPPRVLIVEDELDIAALVELLLTRAGYAVTVVSTGEEGLAELEETGADLVLLDLRLPGMNGWEVCRRVRETSQVPIIIVSAYIRPQDHDTCRSLGADDYVTKPFSGRELVARVGTLLQQRPTPIRPSSGNGEKVAGVNRK
jgi:DNA-binding response OmpR family regulator